METKNAISIANNRFPSAPQSAVVIVNSKGVALGEESANLDVLRETGFLIAQKRTFFLADDQVAALEESGCDAKLFTTGPVTAIQVKSENVWARLLEVQEDLEDVYMSPNAHASLRDEMLFFPTPPQLERTLILIKPGYSPEHYSALLENLDQGDFVVVGKIAKILDPDTAKSIFGDENPEEINYLTSDVSAALCVERMNSVSQALLQLGPRDPTVAMSTAPKSLRARFGTDILHNGYYASPSAERAAKDIEVLFAEPFPLERTLALIKPEAYSSLEGVLELIAQHNFTVIAQETVQLSSARAAEFCHPERNQPYFSALVASLSAGPLVAMVISKPSAIEAWNKIMGPDDPELAKHERPSSLRAHWGQDIVSNGFHGSEDEANAQREVEFFFPELAPAKITATAAEVDNVLKQTSTRAYSNNKESLHSVLVKGLTHLCRVKPVGIDAIEELGNWLLENNPNKPIVSFPSI